MSGYQRYCTERGVTEIHRVWHDVLYKEAQQQNSGAVDPAKTTAVKPAAPAHKPQTTPTPAVKPAAPAQKTQTTPGMFAAAGTALFERPGSVKPQTQSPGLLTRAWNAVTSPAQTMQDAAVGQLVRDAQTKVSKGDYSGLQELMRQYPQMHQFVQTATRGFTGAGAAAGALGTGLMMLPFMGTSGNAQAPAPNPYQQQQAQQQAAAGQKMQAYRTTQDAPPEAPTNASFLSNFFRGAV